MHTITLDLSPSLLLLLVTNIDNTYARIPVTQTCQCVPTNSNSVRRDSCDGVYDVEMCAYHVMRSEDAA